MSPLRLSIPVLVMSILFFHLLSAVTSFDFPTRVTLKAGVLHALPFASVNDDGTFTGFQPDLLDRLKKFAAEDGVELNFMLENAPPQYGAAFDLVSNDCNTTDNPNSLEDCQKFDLIVGDYYSTPSRILRADFSPAWLRSTVSTIKSTAPFVGSELTTLAQAASAGATICIVDGTYLMSFVMQAHPNAEYLLCPKQESCIELLKQGECVLYPDDELQLLYRSSLDPSIQLTREQFNTQYIVWPMGYHLDPTVRLLMKRWIYAAVSNTTLDELYFTYFEADICPFGTAGENCEDYCHPEHGRADQQGHCVCDSMKWTGQDCSIEVDEDLNLIPPALKALGYCMFGFNCVVVVGCGIWLFLKQDTRQVKVMQPFFLALVLLGCLISSSTILALAAESSGDGPVRGCMAIPWLYSLGFSITFGTLFAKIRRIFRIISGRRSAVEMKRVPVTSMETLGVIGLVLLIDVAILAAWTVVSPLEWTREVLLQDTFGESLSSVGYCASEDWIVFASLIAALHLILLFVACYFCYKCRNVSTQFSESKYLALAMVSNLQIYAVGIPVLIIVGSDTAGFFVRSAIIWLNDLAVVAFIFGNLIWSVRTKPHHLLQAAVEHAQRRSIHTSQTSRSAGVPGSNQVKRSESISQRSVGFNEDGTGKWTGEIALETSDPNATQRSTDDSPIGTPTELTSSRMNFNSKADPNLQDQVSRQFEGLKVLVCTANLGNAEPNMESMKTWIPFGGSCQEVTPLEGVSALPSENFDMIVIGMQEATWKAKEEGRHSIRGGVISEEEIVDALDEHYAAALREMTRDILGEEYCLIAEEGRGQMRLSIWASDNVVEGIQDVKISGANTGIGHVMANKGGIVVSLNYNNTRLSFISAHLAAHEGESYYQKRCADVRSILREGKTYDLSKRLDVAVSSHHVFFLGDLNFRTKFDDKESTHEENVTRALDLVATKDYETLYSFDELHQGVSNGDLLSGFTTLQCNFPPTFKLERETGLVYKKQRTPSYTDRILFKSADGLQNSLKPLAYEPCVDFFTSDHKPVRGAFSIVSNSKLGSAVKNGDLRLVFQEMECSDLPVGDADGKSDPYLVFMWDKDMHLKAENVSFHRSFFKARQWPSTRYISKDLNPKWEDDKIVLVGNGAEVGAGAMLYVVVMDFDLVGKHDYLCALPLNLKELLSSLSNQDSEFLSIDRPLLKDGRHCGRIKFKLEIDTKAKKNSNMGGALVDAFRNLRS